jgi:hypothetical protein
LALLTHAKEKPSERQHVFMLLDRLQPRYKPAVLALKLGGLIVSGQPQRRSQWGESLQAVQQSEAVTESSPLRSPAQPSEQWALSVHR